MTHQDDKALRIRFSGGRFNNGIVPTNVLASLDHLAKLIAETTWQEYSEETGQTRRNEYFKKAVILGLAAVETGSTIAAIRPTFFPSTLPGLYAFETCRDRAVRRVYDTVVAAGSGDDIVTILGRKLLFLFEKIVPDLGEDETIGFPDSFGSAPNYAELTYATRNSIIATAKATPKVGLGSLYAYVPKINKRTRTFELAAVDGSIRKDVKYKDDDFKTLHGAWESYRRELGAGLPVRVHGQMEMTQHGRVSGVKSVSAIQEVAPLDVRARLIHLSGLKDGWYDGKGTSYSRDYLESLADRFERWYQDDLPKPAIFPHADGTIGCEWSLPKGACNLIIDPKSDTGDWIDFDLNDDDDLVDRDLRLAHQTDWNWFGQRVASRVANDKP